MGAALVKRCFTSDDVCDSMKQRAVDLHKQQHKQQKLRHARSYTSHNNNNISNQQSRQYSTPQRNHVTQQAQLKQLELQMQLVQLQALQSAQQQTSGYARAAATPRATSGAMMEYYYAARSAAHKTMTPLSVSSASGYSATMSESSFVGSQSDLHAPQDDEILDMVMANAGLAYHPTQQWHRHAVAPLPFAASTHLRPNQSVKSLYRLSFPSKYWASVSPEAIDLVKKLLVLNPNKRLTAKVQANAMPCTMR
uniref:Protein kinase domain-containing protein n=1 Tax=Globisporangium ultimum (strain ATCC 200006 / CBS 805.95 / DAOM BR144) TaxID=431595 RepID=K3W5Q0_GLOUD